LAAPIYAQLGKVAQVGLGSGLIAKEEYGFGDRVLGFLALIRPTFFILTPLNAASAAVLALGGYPTLKLCLLGFFAVAFASCAINVFNDYVDRERDKLVWPNRPVPSGRVKPNEALLVALSSLVISLSLAWFFFNPPTFFILLLAMVLGGIYSLYLRDRVGYLSLPPIVGLIYLGGWAAFSPQTLFTNILPWYLYLLGVAWQAGHIMVYYPLHIADSDKLKTKAPNVFFFTPSPKTAVGIGLVFVALTLLLSVLLPLIAPLGALYLILVIAMGLYALISGLVLFRDVLSRRKGLKAFSAASLFRMTISVAVLLSVFISGVIR
jgi:4-hydroxybenzoate polyprenyltransferase